MKSVLTSLILIAISVLNILPIQLVEGGWKCNSKDQTPGQFTKCNFDELFDLLNVEKCHPGYDKTSEALFLSNGDKCADEGVTKLDCFAACFFRATGILEEQQPGKDKHNTIQYRKGEKSSKEKQNEHEQKHHEKDKGWKKGRGFIHESVIDDNNDKNVSRYKRRIIEQYGEEAVPLNSYDGENIEIDEDRRFNRQQNERYAQGRRYYEGPTRYIKVPIYDDGPMDYEGPIYEDGPRYYGGQKYSQGPVYDDERRRYNERMRYDQGFEEGGRRNGPMKVGIYKKGMRIHQEDGEIQNTDDDYLDFDTVVPNQNTSQSGQSYYYDGQNLDGGGIQYGTSEIQDGQRFDESDNYPISDDQPLDRKNKLSALNRQQSGGDSAAIPNGQQNGKSNAMIQTKPNNNQKNIPPMLLSKYVQQKSHFIGKDSVTQLHDGQHLDTKYRAPIQQGRGFNRKPNSITVHKGQGIKGGKSDEDKGRRGHVEDQGAKSKLEGLRATDGTKDSKAVKEYNKPKRVDEDGDSISDSSSGEHTADKINPMIRDKPRRSKINREKLSHWLKTLFPVKDGEKNARLVKVGFIKCHRQHNLGLLPEDHFSGNCETIHKFLNCFVEVLVCD